MLDFRMAFSLTVAVFIDFDESQEEPGADGGAQQHLQAAVALQVGLHLGGHEAAEALQALHWVLERGGEKLKLENDLSF